MSRNKEAAAAAAAALPYSCSHATRMPRMLPPHTPSKCTLTHQQELQSPYLLPLAALLQYLRCARRHAPAGSACAPPGGTPHTIDTANCQLLQSTHLLLWVAPLLCPRCAQCHELAGSACAPLRGTSPCPHVHPGPLGQGRCCCPSVLHPAVTAAAAAGSTGLEQCANGCSKMHCQHYSTLRCTHTLMMYEGGKGGQGRCCCPSMPHPEAATEQ
jgi:hypothetical protein